MQFNILIIDDEKNIREGLADAMELEGYNAFVAEDGKAGLARIAKGDIDLVITDLRMPGVTGEQVLSKVTAENPGVPVIVLTGHGSIDAAVDAMRNGAYDFLTKPLNLDQLTMIVKRALEGRMLALQHRQVILIALVLVILYMQPWFDVTDVLKNSIFHKFLKGILSSPVNEIKEMVGSSI